MARAFGTTPVVVDPEQRTSTRRAVVKQQQTTPESLDTDSVMTFLHHLGVSHYEVHKRISDMLLKQLEDEIRKSSSSSSSSATMTTTTTTNSGGAAPPQQALLDLLQSCWAYATTMSELRPVLWAVLKQLGEQTPLAVLLALSEREEDSDNQNSTNIPTASASQHEGGTTADPVAGMVEDNPARLKHAAIFQPLPPLLKRLCWEADWDVRVPIESFESDTTTSTSAYLQVVQSTLLFHTIQPLIQQYCTNPVLVAAANRPFVGTVRERRVLTKQRRALTTTTTTTTTAAAAAASSLSTAATPGTTTAAAATTSISTGVSLNLTTSAVLRGATGSGGGGGTSTTTTTVKSANDLTSSGRAVSQLRNALCDSTSSSYTFRPKLLYALLSTLMTQHGSSASRLSSKHGNEQQPATAMGMGGGANDLSCTLVTDLLLSAGGPLPKAYQHVVVLARVLDDAVQEGNITNAQIERVQAALKEIFQPDNDGVITVNAAGSAKGETAEASSTDRQEDVSTDLATTTKLLDEPSNAVRRQLNKIIQAGIDAMKDADPQNLFLNPVTDDIAPGYSRVIKKPMSIVTMEQKIHRNEYSQLAEWEADCKLMFRNCIEYNQGAAGQWFRGEANRQGKVFQKEVWPNAKRLYQNEIAKHKKTAAQDAAAAAAAAAKAAAAVVSAAPKRSADQAGIPAITPLLPSNKKRKKEKEEYLPSMPAVASMILADPVRGTTSILCFCAAQCWIYSSFVIFFCLLSSLSFDYSWRVSYGNCNAVW